jgi:hypothetical protein
MSFIKKLLITIGIALIAIQFVKPDRNKSIQVLATDISNTISIPDGVQAVLKNACYDCHSNNTVYPWYSNVQPMCWFMDHHIKKGKKELNFCEFGSYSTRKQISKLDGIANSIRDDIMPLSSYKLMHKNAQLNTFEKTLIINWALESKDSLSAKQL